MLTLNPFSSSSFTPSSLRRAFTVKTSTAVRVIASTLTPTFASVADLMENRGRGTEAANKIRDFGKRKFVPRYRALLQEMEKVGCHL